VKKETPDSFEMKNQYRVHNIKLKSVRHDLSINERVSQRVFLQKPPSPLDTTVRSSKLDYTGTSNILLHNP